jgi:beta-glucosidase
VPDRTFPAGFTWGTGAAAYQVEGGIDLDGRGPSIWDTFAHTPGRVRDGATGDVAVDHRNRWREDVALLAELGVGAYRLSIAWPRVQPRGSGEVSQSGLDFYRIVVDELLTHGIEPFVTLYHWDLPQALEDEGGWPARATAERFGEYAGIVAGALGDRVQRWGTVNEPWCASMLGHAVGIHAPGRRDEAAAVAAAHHLLLGHGLAVDAVRAAAPGAQLSITLNPYPVVAAGDRDEDLDAVRRVDGLANRWWYDAVLRGEYPADVLDDVSSVTDLAFVRDGDLAAISRPIDSLGINYYRRHHVRWADEPAAVPLWPGSPHVELVEPPGAPTDLGWAIEPDGLREALMAVSEGWSPPPLFVHENGACFTEVHDDQRRIDFLDAHLTAAHEAIAAGVDLRGYFVWTLLDNFEWAEGFQAPFGLVHVDLDTLERTPRRSFAWYRDVIAAGGR